MRELPQGWEWSTLGEIADYGKTCKVEPADIKPEHWVLELEDIEKDTSRLLQRIYNSERRSKSTKNCFKQGDVLYGKLRPYLNKVLLADNDGVCTTEIIPLSMPIGGDNRYLFYFLKHPEFIEYVTSISHGLNMPRLGTKAGQSAKIPLAPLNEQKRIADKLDSLLSKVDACRERLERVPLILKRFRQAVLAAATSGALTEDWRGCQDLKTWQTTSLNNICHSITDGDHQAPPQIEEGIPFITISAINNGRLNLNKATRFVPKGYYDELKENRKPKIGDVLFSVTGSIAIPALVDITEPFVFQRHIAILRPDLSKITSKYLLYSLGTESIKDQALGVATGTAQLTVPLNGLRSFKIDLPPNKEQLEIVRRIESLFAFADRLESRYTAACALVENMTSALLKKAFRGELVPQDPTDEPAENVLKRVSADKSEQSTPKKHGSKSTFQQETTTMKTKTVANLGELVDIVDSLSGEAKPERLIAESGLTEKIDFFFELLREGRDQHVLDVPVGSNAPIRRKSSAHR